MFPDVTLRPVSREDVERLVSWLSDPEVSSLWYGLGEDRVPLHIGYSPHLMCQATDQEWQLVFGDEDRKIYSIYTSGGDHVGEGQLIIEWPLSEAQVFILIGRKDLWHHHYGTMTMIKILNLAFDTFGLHRVRVDVPEYNVHALQMCRHIGFVLEGQLRKTHRKDDHWYDSIAMGLLADEYSRRRARLMGVAADRTA